MVKLLSRELGISPLTARVLIQRGVLSPEAAHRFLHPSLDDLPSPFLMKDMEKAVLRLERALKEKEPLTIYGDYDVDGTTGSSLLYLFLRELGAEAEVYIPHRIQEGYGLNIKALEKLREQGRKLVVTVDNGISSVTEAERAREIGLDLIIIDHHQVPPKIPFAHAILNPKQEDCSHPSKELAGVGVAFQLALGLRNHLRRAGFFEGRAEPNLKKYLALVTLGTIADLVPLTGLNRILVKMGLEVLSESKSIGLSALKEVAGTQGKITPGQVGFRLGPRINAAGRLHSAKVGFDLLTATDSQTARGLAESLDKANQERQALEETIVNEACARVEKEGIPQTRRSIFLSDGAWHLGVIGIVASRLVDRYYLPAIVGREENGEIRCSARSISGLDLYDTLKGCEEDLVKFGGHRQAAGLTLSSARKDSFWNRFDQGVRGRLGAEDFIPRIRVDAKVLASEIEAPWLEELERLEPFGQGNPEPVFMAEDLRLSESRLVGNNHLKLFLRSQEKTLEAIGFGMGDAQLPSDRLLKCVFTCQFNEFRGERRIQLKLVDPPKI